jgi:hypothetical protein
MRCAAGCLFVVLLALAPAAKADGLLDSFGKATGMIAPPIDPPDFVKNSRPSEERPAIPVFAPPPEPRSKVKTPAELKAMDADLEGVSDGREQRQPKVARRRKSANRQRGPDGPAMLRRRPNCVSGDYQCRSGEKRRAAGFPWPRRDLKGASAEQGRRPSNRPRASPGAE